MISRILNSTNDTIALFPYNVAENNIVNKHFLLTCLYYKIREWEQSYLHFELFIEEFIISNEEIPVYYLCVKDFIKDKKDNVLITDIRNRLVAKYDREIVDEVINDLSDSDNIFRPRTRPSHLCMASNAPCAIPVTLASEPTSINSGSTA